MRQYPAREQILTKLLKYCNIISDFLSTTDGTYESFEKDIKTNFSVSFALQQIGELIKYLSPEFAQETREQVPWNRFRDMRNMYAHEYERMYPQDIFETAVNDIPVLKNFCEKYLITDGESELV
jgi:uncharacterized protein with HEPN domain